jgi:hypothetical protein
LRRRSRHRRQPAIETHETAGQRPITWRTPLQRTVPLAR